MIYFQVKILIKRYSRSLIDRRSFYTCYMWKPYTKFVEQLLKWQPYNVWRLRITSVKLSQVDWCLMLCLWFDPPCSTSDFLQLWLAVGLGLAKSICLCFIMVINLIFVSSLWCIDWVRELLCEPNVLCIFVLRNTSGPRVKFVDSQKYFNPPPLPPVVYATTVLRWWSRCGSVWLCGLYYGTIHVLKSSGALCPRVSLFLLTLWSLRLEKSELTCVLLVHLFVCFLHVSFVLFLFLFVSGNVTVALPGLFY